MNRKIKVAELI